MNYAINATAVSRRKGGASFYIVNITKAIALINKQDTFYIFVTSIGMDQFKGLPPNFKILPVSPSNVFLRLIWEQITLPFLLCKKYKITTLFSPNYTSPIIHPGFQTVVTIHDLSFFPLAKLYPISRRLFKPIIHLSVKTSNNVVAVSEFTRKDIIKYIGPYYYKIKVIYEAADSRFIVNASSVQEVEKIKEKYCINDEYILFTGFLEPRKNLERLLQAYALIKKNIKHKLVIAGGEGWWFNKTYERVEQLGLKDHVIFTGYVQDDELPALYTGATLFAFPSLYEGFGIAAIEAVFCGTPVLASNNTALPEVVGEAGEYVNPYDFNDIAEKMLNLLISEEKMQKKRDNCEEVRKKFSWEKAAIETLSLFK